MTNILQIIFEFFTALPTPVAALIGLVFFIGVLTTLLRLIKLILDAIPFV